MNETIREKLDVALSMLSERYPHWRFAQLVANVAYWAKGPTDGAIWDVEDSELLAAAEQHLQKVAATDSVPQSKKTA